MDMLSPLVACIIAISLRIEVCNAQIQLTYMQDMCLAFKPLYWVQRRRPQFAVLTVNHAGGWNPAHPDQEYNPHTLIPGQGHNYMSAAYVRDPDDQNPAHTEPVVLAALNNLWNNFLGDHEYTPRDVVLFTYNSPCNHYGPNDCAGMIITVAQQQPFSTAQWYVGFNQMFRPRGQTSAQAQEQLNEARQRLNAAHIELDQICNCKGHRVPRSISAMSTGCSLSFQQSMFQCLRRTSVRDFGLCWYNVDAMWVILVNKAVWQCPKLGLMPGDFGCWVRLIHSESLRNGCWLCVRYYRSILSCAKQQGSDYRVGKQLDPTSVRSGHVSESSDVKHLTSSYSTGELRAIMRLRNRG